MKYATIGAFSCALALSACSDAEPGGKYDKDDLALGSSGPKVREVFDYLTRYGYFENAALREVHVREATGFLNPRYAFHRFLGIGSEPQRFIAARRRWEAVSEVAFTEVTLDRA